MIWVWIIVGIFGVGVIGWFIWLLITNSKDPAAATVLLELITDILSALGDL